MLLNEAVAWTHTQDLTSSAQALCTPRKIFFMHSSRLLQTLQGLPTVLGIMVELFTCYLSLLRPDFPPSPLNRPFSLHLEYPRPWFYSKLLILSRMHPASCKIPALPFLLQHHLLKADPSRVRASSGALTLVLPVTPVA